MIDELTNVVSWNEVEGATHYNYIINGEEIDNSDNGFMNKKTIYKLRGE